MINESSPLIRHSVLFPREERATQRFEDPNFSTGLVDGEAIIIDNRFALVFRRTAYSHRRFDLEVAVVRHSQDSFEWVNHRGESEVFPPVSDASSNDFAFKFFRIRASSPSLIKFGDRRLDIRQIFVAREIKHVTNLEQAIKVDSPSEFSFERIQSGAHIIEVKERLMQLRQEAA